MKSKTVTLTIITCFVRKDDRKELTLEISHFYSAISSLRWATFDVATSTIITRFVRKETVTMIAKRQEQDGYHYYWRVFAEE